MIDIDETTCRICLENGAIYPIFESNEEFESVYAKLAICIREKVEDIEGYPHNICLKCKNTSDIISNFVAKFEKSCEILKSKIVHIKKEYLEDYNIDISDNELEPFTYELQTDEPVKPKDEKRDPTELFESLSHLTVKRIKVENIFETFCNENENNIQKKRGRPKKDRQTDCKTKKAKGDSLAKRKGVTKKAKSKKVGETGAATKSKGKAKKAVAKPVVGKNNGASKQSNKDTSKQEIEKHRTPKKEGIETNQTKATRIPRLCDLCGITCAHSDILARHKISVHGEKNHKCNKCTKTYFTKHQLNVHYMSRHENVITAVCDYCGKGFFAKHRLRVHVVTVHFKKKKNPHVYKCEFCEKTFKYKKGAINHERAVHTGERPAACDVCGSSFFDVSYLKQHKRLHTGETPYKCPVCARGYAQCGNMKSHMRNHRISELDPEILAKVKPSYYKFMRP